MCVVESGGRFVSGDSKMKGAAKKATYVLSTRLVGDFVWPNCILHREHAGPCNRRADRDRRYLRMGMRRAERDGMRRHLHPPIVGETPRRRAQICRPPQSHALSSWRVQVA